MFYGFGVSVYFVPVVWILDQLTIDHLVWKRLIEQVHGSGDFPLPADLQSMNYFLKVEYEYSIYVFRFLIYFALAVWIS